MKSFVSLPSLPLLIRRYVRLFLIAGTRLLSSLGEFRVLLRCVVLGVGDRWNFSGGTWGFSRESFAVGRKCS